MVSYADSLDCVGVLGKTIDVVRQVFSESIRVRALCTCLIRSDTISHHDKKDMTCANADIREKARQNSLATIARIAARDSKTPLKGLRIGIPIQTHFPTPSIQLSTDLLRHLKSLGAELKAVDLPSLNYTLPAYYVLASAEASSNLARFGGGWYGSRLEREATGNPDESGEERRFRVRTAGFGMEVKKRILAGTHALSAK